MDDIFQKVVDEHLDEERSKQGQEDIIDVLLKIEKEQAESGGGQFTRDNIKAILTGIFFAGIDTSASTTEWAMAELVRDPKALKKAQEEVRSLIENKGKIRKADLDNIELMVKETLRLHPPAPMLVPRETISPFKINDYGILPKIHIYVNAWAIGRDPTFWDDPEKFVPERFEGSSIDFKGQHHFELLPFGGGRRGCPGMLMGLVWWRTIQNIEGNSQSCD